MKSASEPETAAGTRALVGVVPGLQPLVLELDPSDLDDPQLLERHVRAHNELLLEAFERGPVVPIRFGTFFADEAGVSGWLERHEEALSAELDRLRDRAEWALTVSAPTAAEPVAATSPASYLEERLAAGEATAQRLAELRDHAQRWHQRLLGVAEDWRPGPPRGSGLVLDETYLVPTALQREFDSVLAEIQREAAGAGLETRATGPWPPFGFVSEDLR